MQNICQCIFMHALVYNVVIELNNGKLSLYLTYCSINMARFMVEKLL